MGRVVALLAVLFGLAVSCTGFREDEIACEQAVSHMVDCCPRFNAGAVDCSYSDSADCTGNAIDRVYPALSINESHTLEATACVDLVARGECARVPRLARRR